LFFENNGHKAEFLQEYSFIGQTVVLVAGQKNHYEAVLASLQILERYLSTAVTTKARLERLVRPFKFVANGDRKFEPNAAMLPCIASIACDGWQESSPGDKMHKLILVLAGQVDVEGASGGWLVIPNHFIFIPAERPFNLRASRKSHVIVAYLHPDDHPWHHHGCWVTQANTFALEYFAHLLRASATESKTSEPLRQLFRTLAFLCQDWFANPRILWLPAAKSEEMRTFITYARDRLSDVSVAAACKACKLAPRTLQRLSQQEFSFGLKTLITEIRMMRAMELLVNGDISVETVANSVGFSSLGSFTSAFTERVGVSPGEFKQKNRAALRACQLNTSFN
jgi:AraC-like DNA-binding protein